jgi:hypothetical protein
VTKDEREKMRATATAAQQVRPGTWVRWVDTGHIGDEFGGDAFVEVMIDEDGGNLDDIADEDPPRARDIIAEHIAKSCPEAMLRLLDALDAADGASKLTPSPEEWAAFNNWTHPIGALVDVTRDNGHVERTKTRSMPWWLGASNGGTGHTPVIMLDGISGGYLLTRVRVVPAEAESA